MREVVGADVRLDGVASLANDLSEKERFRTGRKILSII
jgi:hypothetical protein